MKIVFVHEVSWFNKVVYEMHDFPELLSLRGHQVHFLDYDEGRSRARWKTLTTVESRAHQGSSVWVTTPPRLLPGICGRLLATIIQPLVFIQLLRRVRPDVVVCYSVPTSGWQIVKICNLRKVPIVARIIDVSHALRPTPFSPLVKLAERYVYRHANAVSTHNEALRQYCLDLGAKPENCVVTYPGVDLIRFYPAPPDPTLQRRLGIEKSDKVLLFMGTVFRFSGLYELLTELSGSMRRDPSIKLLILGDGEDLARIQRLTSSLGIAKQVPAPGRIDYQDLADHLRLGTIALLPFKEGLLTHCALPNKVLQYLACGLPTVATRLEGLESMLPNHSGLVYTSTTAEMATTAMQLLSHSRLLSAMSSLGRHDMAKLCDWSTQLDIFETLLTTYGQAVQ